MCLAAVHLLSRSISMTAGSAACLIIWSNRYGLDVVRPLHSEVCTCTLVSPFALPEYCFVPFAVSLVQKWEFRRVKKEAARI